MSTHDFALLSRDDDEKLKKIIKVKFAMVANSKKMIIGGIIIDLMKVEDDYEDFEKGNYGCEWF